MTDEYVTRREFDAAQKFNERALGTLERSLHEGQRRIEDEMRRQTEAFKESKPRDDKIDSLALAITNMADAVRKQPTVTDALANLPKSGGGVGGWIGGGSTVGLLAMIAYEFFGK